MNEANLAGALLDLVGAAVLPYASDRSIRSTSDKTALPWLLAAWADGRSYEHLLHILEENAELRISSISSPFGLAEEPVGLLKPRLDLQELLLNLRWIIWADERALRR